MHTAIKIALAVPVILVIALGVAALRSGRGLNRVEILIRASPQAVWQHLVEPARVKAWVTGLVELESLTGGELRVGARDRMVVQVGDQRATATSEITAVELERRIDQRLTMDEGMFRCVEDASFTLEPAANGHTRFVIEGRTVYGTLLGRLLEPMITGAARKKLGEDLEKLKANVERGEDGPST